ncbi:hypothetical protein LTR53_012272 [Teratosphaeriaceae sp. CCFEE 6253]|nr:hypothetical protein LTR53_012272 [Teratosphaeriaceae sp. CCFEE 6253]
MLQITCHYYRLGPVAIFKDNSAVLQTWTWRIEDFIQTRREQEELLPNALAGREYVLVYRVPGLTDSSSGEEGRDVEAVDYALQKLSSLQHRENGGAGVVL